MRRHYRGADDAARRRPGNSWQSLAGIGPNREESSLGLMQPRAGPHWLNYMTLRISVERAIRARIARGSPSAFELVDGSRRSRR